MNADKLLKFLKPVVEWIGSLHFPHVIKQIDGKHYFKYIGLIGVGDVFLTSTNGVGSSYLNFTSTYKHSAMYIGRVEGVPTVIEASSKGVVLTDLVTFFTSKDKIRVLSNKLSKKTPEEEIQGLAFPFLGGEYDYVFNDSNKKYYCHELVAAMINGLHSDCALRKERVGLLCWERDIYSPKSFIDNKIIFDDLGDI